MVFELPFYNKITGKAKISDRVNQRVNNFGLRNFGCSFYWFNGMVFCKLGLQITIPLKSNKLLEFIKFLNNFVFIV